MDLSVKINGQALELGVDVLFASAELDMHVNKATMFTMHVVDKAEAGLFSGPKYKHLDGSKFKIGAKIEVKAREYGDKMFKTLAKNLEIVSVEPSFGQGKKIMFTIRAYDKTQRMRRGIQSRTFLKMSDADIIKKICGEYGVSPKVTGLATKHDYVIQHSQSDWEFIQARARLSGCVCFVDKDGKLVVSPLEKSANSASVTLEYPEECLKFSPKVNAANQVALVETFAYDSNTAQPVKSKATIKNVLNGASKLKAEVEKGVQKKSKFQITQHPSVKAAIAKELSDSASNRIGMESVEATGLCLGNVSLAAGGKVKIKNVGKRFSGTYIVSGVVHRFSHSGGFVSEFVVSNIPSIAELLYNKVLDRQRENIDGVVVGVVTNIEDEEKLGRVKVKFPWLGEEVESDWARVATPMASTSAGVFFPVAINDEVIVAFEQGNPNRPFVLGSLYTKKIEHPNTKAIEKDKVNFLTFKGRSGHYIEFSEKEGSEEIAIVGLKGKSYLKFDTNKGNLDIKMAEDVKIACKNLTIDSKGKINVKAMQDIAFKSNTKFTLVAQQKVAIKGGMSVELATNSGKSVKIGPATVNINAGALEVM